MCMEITSAQLKKLENVSKELTSALKVVNKNWKELSISKKMAVSDLRWTIAFACDELDSVLAQAKTMNGRKTSVSKRK